MTIAVEAQDALERLARSTSALLVTLDAFASAFPHAQSGGVREAIAIVTRYREMLTGAVRANEADTALRAANLLTTVNRGLGDTVAIATDPTIAQAGLETSRLALAAAGQLRADGVTAR